MGNVIKVMNLCKKYKTLKKEDLENKDILKEKVATDNNYNYIVIWDCDKNDHNLKLILDYYKNKNLL